MENKHGCISPRCLSGKETASQCRSHRRLGFDPWVWKISWSGKWQSTPVFFFFLIAHSSILAGIISGTEKPGRLQSIGSQRDWATEHSTFPQNSHVEILTPKWMALGGSPVKSDSVMRVEPSQMGLVAFIKEIPSPFKHMRTR